MKDMPENVLVYTARYKITETDEPIIVDGRQCGGECDYNKCEITLSKKEISGGRVPLVLMHEVVHAMLFENGLTEEADNEEAVEKIAKGIIDLIGHNPQLVRYIQLS